MPRFVRFPGTPGNYLSTPDVNLLDADTAHIHQSVGGWVNNTNLGNIGQASDLAPVVGSLHGLGNPQNTGSAQDPNGWHDAVGEPAAPGETFTFISSLSTDTPGIEARVAIFWFNAGGGIISSVSGSLDPLTAGTFFEQSVTGTAPALTTHVRGLIWFVTTNPSWDLATKLYWDASCLRQGSDPTFVPSLRIVGDLDETNDPLDFVASFPGDGTPLLLGDLWAGDGVSYIRRDGIGGPVVAQFDPDDIVLP